MQQNAFEQAANDGVEAFSARADAWWDAEGPFRMLHRLQPLRVAYLEKMVRKHFGIAGTNDAGWKKLRVLDVGCGGGLIAEAMAKRGADVTGIDLSAPSIEVARAHAAKTGVPVDYRVGAVENLAQKDEKYDVVTAFEIVEHLADTKPFFEAIRRLTKPRGLLVLATVNRTLRSLLFGVVAAEYVLDWVPAGTHDWTRFPRPSELVRRLETTGFAADDLSGVVFDPLTGAFSVKPHRLAINYLLTARAD